MNRILSALLLSSITFPSLAPPALSQAQALPQTVAFCFTNPGICTAVAVVGGYMIYRNGVPPEFIPRGSGFPNRRPDPHPSREFYNQVRDQTFGAVTSADCNEYIKVLRRAGYQASFRQVYPNNLGRGWFKKICVIATDAPETFVPRINRSRQ